MKGLKTSGIYFIKNLVNGKVYVGSSVNVPYRLTVHKRTLIKGEHRNIKLQRAWDKYGKDKFVFISVEKVFDLESLIPREQYWIDYMNSAKQGYNIRSNADSQLGYKHTKKSKIKMSKSKKGCVSNRKGVKLSDETIRKILETRKKNHIMKIKLKKQLKCKRCGHQWNPYKTEVRICPKCKSAWWDKVKKQ